MWQSMISILEIHQHRIINQSICQKFQELIMLMQCPHLLLYIVQSLSQALNVGLVLDLDLLELLLVLIPYLGSDAGLRVGEHPIMDSDVEVYIGS